MGHHAAAQQTKGTMGFDHLSQTIEKALQAAGLRGTAAQPVPPGAAPGAPGAPGGSWAAVSQVLKRAAEAMKAPPAAPPRAEGRMLQRAYTNPLGTRAYRLYVPGSPSAKAAPLILMLHGCKQNPEDFAAGTRMNELAERHGFLVAYPEQTARDNGGNCWNWFERAQQAREGAEPSLLAGIVADVARTHAVDPARVFAAGLSAGAAMAVILGSTHPDVFAGVAAHSGLPAGAASDVASAFAAMRGRRAPPHGQHGQHGTAAVPTFVMHGDADATVAAGNGDAIVERAAQAHERAGMALARQAPAAHQHGGRAATVTRFLAADGRPRIEHWSVAGGGHTWFGGSPQGSYTDAGGPDASAEMVRFFLGLGYS